MPTSIGVMSATKSSAPRRAIAINFKTSCHKGNHTTEVVKIARIHGRRGLVYIGIASDTADASPVPFLSSWSISFEVEKAEVTAFGDNNKIYVAGLPDASGEFSGFYSDDTAQTYTAATDGLPRKFYLYPNSATPTKYFFGTVLPDFSVNAAVGGAVEISASWNANSDIKKVG